MNKTASPSSIAVGILGGTSYGASELLRLFVHHPFANVISMSSTSAAGKSVSEIHPHLAEFYDLRCSQHLNLDAFESYPNKIVFSALPHGISGTEISWHYEAWQQAGIRCIDLSGDLRIKNHDLHQQHYPDSPLLQELRQIAVYGLPELTDQRTLQEASLVANPGCLATAALISLMPASQLAIETTVTMNLATGSSGSGKDPKTTTHHPTRHANFYAYKPLHHQHEGEIIEAAQRLTGHTLTFNLVPHSLPVARGILCTTYLQLTQHYTQEDIYEIVQPIYARFPFIRLRINQSAELQNVVGSNFAEVSLSLRDRTLVVIVTLDNLVKGMAGQAIQNMNTLFGIPEKTGLWFPAIKPI